MKKWILLIWVFCVQLLAVHAESEYYTIFKVGSNICTPVTLKTPYGNYTIHTEITIPNSLSWFEAFDCEGKKIMDTGGKVSVGTGKPTVRIYYLTTCSPTPTMKHLVQTTKAIHPPHVILSLIQSGRKKQLKLWLI